MNTSVDKAEPIKIFFLSFSVKTIHTALPSTPPNTFGMNWMLGLIAQNLWPITNTCLNSCRQTQTRILWKAFPGCCYSSILLYYGFGPDFCAHLPYSNVHILYVILLSMCYIHTLIILQVDHHIGSRSVEGAAATLPIRHNKIHQLNFLLFFLLGFTIPALCTILDRDLTVFDFVFIYCCCL